MAYAGRPDGPFVVASPPLGAYRTGRPVALATTKEVVLYLAREEGGYEVLRSPDLRGWDAVPATAVTLPEEGIACFTTVWVDPAVLEDVERTQ